MLLLFQSGNKFINNIQRFFFSFYSAIIVKKSTKYLYLN